MVSTVIPTLEQGGIWDEILTERKRQDQKWGADRRQHHMIWLTILVEEVGELAEAILKNEVENIWKELIHVLAVGVAYAEDALRKEAGYDENSDDYAVEPQKETG